MKKKIGYAMIISLFAGIFILGAFLTTFLTTLAIFAAAIVIGGFIMTAQYLINSK